MQTTLNKDFTSTKDNNTARKDQMHYGVDARVLMVFYCLLGKMGNLTSGTY